MWNYHKIDKIRFNDDIEIEIDKHLTTQFQNYLKPPQDLEVGLYDIPVTGSLIVYWNGETWLEERSDFVVTEYSIDESCPEWYREYTKTLFACHYKDAIQHFIKVNE